MQEEWKPCVGYEGRYEVSNIGRVKSLVTNQLLKPATDKLGRKQVALSLNSKVKATRIHRLVAKAFISNHENKPQVNHIDNNPSNNCVENLEWCTAKENTQHMLKQNRQNPPNGERQGGHVLTEDIVRKIKKLSKDKTYYKIGKELGINYATVYDIIKNKTWKHITCN